MTNRNNEKYLDNPLFPFPEHKKDKGGSSGGSGGKSKFQSPTEANLSASDLPSSGKTNEQNSRFKSNESSNGNGSPVVYRGGINSFDRVVANWSSLSENMRNNLNLIAMTQTGQKLINRIENIGLQFEIREQPYMSFIHVHCPEVYTGDWPIGDTRFNNIVSIYKDNSKMFYMTFIPIIFIANDVNRGIYKDENENPYNVIDVLGHELGHFDHTLDFFDNYNPRFNELNVLPREFKEARANTFKDAIKKELFIIFFNAAIKGR